MNQNKKDNSGALFMNKRKDKESQPDLTGSATINGEEYWLSAWDNETKEGEAYLSVSLKKKDSEKVDHKKSTPLSEKMKSKKAPEDESMPF